MNAAVAEVTTRFGTDVTVAFFPDKSRKAKQLRMYQKSMKDFMPVVSEEKDPQLHRCAAVCVCLHTCKKSLQTCSTSHTAQLDAQTRLAAWLRHAISSRVIHSLSFCFGH